MGSPGGLIGHTSMVIFNGFDIEDANKFSTILEGFDKDTKFIVHGEKFIKEAQEDLCLIKMVILLD